MSIRKVRIEGFRSLRDTTWEPRKLNLVIGPNGSGKSNLLRALALLQKSATGNLSEVLRLGGIAPLLWDGQAKEIAWTVETDPIDDTDDPAGHSLTYELRLTSLSLVGTPSDPVLLGFKSTLAGWSVYHDIHVDQQAALRQAAVARTERRVATDGQNLIPVLHTLYTGNQDFKKLVDDAMRVAFRDDYEELVFSPAAGQRIQLRVRSRSLKTEQSAADLPDGTIWFLLLLAILGNPAPGALIAIDEPETGLHPSMLPIVAELAVDASERSQVVLTTHSPQLLDAFTDTPPTVTVAQLVDGETRLTVIDGDELRRWLTDYRLGALFLSGELEGMAPESPP